jgi:hypothetical protein
MITERTRPDSTHLIFHSARQDQQAFIEDYDRDVVAQLRRQPAMAR